MGGVVGVVQALAAVDGRAVGGVGGLGGMAGSVLASEWISNPQNQADDPKARAKKAEEEAKRREELLKKKASQEELEIRRQRNDQWRHEPKGPTTYGKLVRAERQAMRDKEQADREAAEAEAEAEAEREKKKGKERKLFDDKKDIEIVDRRRRGAPKKAQALPEQAPNPFSDSNLSPFQEAKLMRGGGIIPAPTVIDADEREKTAGARSSRAISRVQSKGSGDVSDEVNELLAELENSDLMKDAKANTSANKDTSKNQAFAGGLFDGLMEGYTGDHEYKADEHKRRSLQILQEEEERGVFNSKEGLTAMLEVFDQELHNETMGKLHSKKKKDSGVSKRQLNRERRHQLAVEKLPADLMPY